MINANEQRVIDVASGTFEYQGELYTVRPTYFKTLTNKLNEKDVELTSEQADRAIQKIFGNVDRGVKEGYLKKLSKEEAAEAKKQGEVRPYSELDLTGSGEDGQTGEQSGEQQESQVVTGKDGQTYPIQQAPLQLNELDALRTSEIEAVQTYTPNEQIAGQINGNERNMAVAVLLSWVVCIVAVTIYLKKLKHRKKAFLVMLGASLMSLSILVAGNIYVNNSWAYSADTWQTVAVESGYFKECSKLVHEDLQKIFSGIGMEASVDLLALEDSDIYEDAKSIFSAHLTGRELPKLGKRQKEIQESLRLVLIQESTETINEVSDVIMERYRKVLDTPYAAYLYQLRQEEKNRNVMLIGGCLVLLLISIIFIWRGSKYIHRKFRGLSYGIGMAGTSFVVAKLTETLWATKMQAEPKEYQSLFQQYMSWRSENIFYFGVLLLCISVFTWGAAYVTKKSHIEKQSPK